MTNDWTAKQERKNVRTYGNPRKGKFKNAPEKQARTRAKLAAKEAR